MLKKTAIVLLLCWLAGANAWAQNYPVLDTGDPDETACNPKSYTDLGNGIIRDNITGLEWERWGASAVYTWQQAQDYCDSLTLGGSTDWRLPSVEELLTLMDAGCDVIVIDPVFFSYADSYWTVTASANNLSRAFFVDFGNGLTNVESKTETLRVRAVRGGTSVQHGSVARQAPLVLDVSAPSAGEPCSSDLSCGTDESCINDICIPSAGELCSSDLDCTLGGACVNDVCVPSIGDPCSSDLDCGSNGQCINDICIPSTDESCVDDRDCDPGEVCIEDMCAPDGEPGRYSVNGDGTVFDYNTGLVWAYCAYGQTWDGSQCTGEPQVLAWDEAEAHITALNASSYLGYDDWRFPTKNELESLMYRAFVMPTSTFPDMDSGFYWSSTKNMYGEVWSACYWFGNFHAEVPKTMDDTYTMRAVRGGQCRASGGLCTDDADCSDGYVCSDGVCVEDVCELIVKHKRLRSEKLTKPRKVALKITGDEDFDVYGAIDLGPLTSDKVRYNSKKGKLKIKAFVPEGLEPGIISISVGECAGEVVIE